jgi:hypothetical protein
MPPPVDTEQLERQRIRSDPGTGLLSRRSRRRWANVPTADATESGNLGKRSSGCQPDGLPDASAEELVDDVLDGGLEVHEVLVIALDDLLVPLREVFPLRERLPLELVDVGLLCDRQLLA